MLMHGRSEIDPRHGITVRILGLGEVVWYILFIYLFWFYLFLFLVVSPLCLRFCVVVCLFVVLFDFVCVSVYLLFCLFLFVFCFVCLFVFVVFVIGRFWGLFLLFCLLLFLWGRSNMFLIGR